MKKLVFAIIAFALIAFAFERNTFSPSQTQTAAIASAPASDSALEAAIDAQAENIQVQGQGTVVKILPDDNNGSPHQRFIVRLPSGHTVLIAHNIDLAARVSPLSEGDTVEFSGEYIWNPKGGVVHWTHHDPAGRHEAGWIRHEGQTVQ